MDNMTLQEWINANEPKDEMYWKKSWLNQVCFVRDQIPKLLCVDYESYKAVKDSITVISTHTSKSIALPVYCIEANGDKFIMRDNFYDWKVSVETKNIHNIDFQKLGIVHDTSAQIHSVYCEGFLDEWVYKPYNESKGKYTVEIGDDFNLKLFFWVIQMKDKIWEE